MKKVVLASLLAVAGVAPLAQTCLAQQPASTGTGQAQAQGGQIQMSADEYKAYNDANTASGAAKIRRLRGLPEGVPELGG